MEPVKIPIEDIIDLHTFRPKDVPDLLEDYFSACIDKGIFSVRWGDALLPIKLNS
jgi:hypothetical protein